jgi:hypothetical protein
VLHQAIVVPMKLSVVFSVAIMLLRNVPRAVWDHNAVVRMWQTVMGIVVYRVKHVRRAVALKNVAGGRVKVFLQVLVRSVTPAGSR